MEYTGGIFKTGLNLTAESLRYKYNIGTDMVVLNMCVYVLEMILLFLSVITVTVYLIISKLNRRFHNILRVLMNLMCFGMLFNTIFRLFLVPMRLLFGHGSQVKWLDDLNAICQTGQLIAIFQIETTVFLISIERAIATRFIRRYEYMFTTRKHIIVFTTTLVLLLYGTAFYLYVARGNVYEETPQTTLLYVSYVMTASNLIGFALLRFTQCMTRRHLNSPDKALSKSFQCHENLRVVRLVSPVYILLFICRICQFIFRVYVYYINYSFGAFLMRVLAHMYNVSLAVSVFVTPLLLIVLQPALLSKIWKRSQNQVNYSEPDHQRVTKAYFESLTTMWK
ncbi:hypothetical protein Q1695_014191 [Nippostrongylus brasiliensis]|nr:hypothetical protein Q1695_014191 [Nippostrongylus brasiliensis]